MCVFLAQATTGKQGVLGPTKIYLAVQPAPNSQQAVQSSQNSTTANTPTTATPKPQVTQQPADSPPAATGNVSILFFSPLYFMFIQLY